jgi:ribosomal protein S18 acetylase RimI-like enzyme
MRIREATETDSYAGSAVLRRSIAELCAVDHGADPDAIARWTANKTPETWVAWVNHPTASLHVAEQAGQVVGVCMISTAGEILLNYVCPDSRFMGVSKAMLEHMEARAMARGLACCTLESTKTALRFYRAQGYELDPEAEPARLTMRKDLKWQER